MASINKISNLTLEKMKKKSILTKPANMSARGVTQDQVKAALTSSMFDENNSLTSEINRIVDEINDGTISRDEAETLVQNTSAYSDLLVRINDVDDDLQTRLDDLIEANLLEHNYYLQNIQVNELNNNVWTVTDDRITLLRDGLSLTLVVPVTTNKEFPLILRINQLSNGYIIYDINDASKTFILKEGSVIQLIGIQVSSTFYYVVISDSKGNTSYHYGDTEGDNTEGTLWFDTNN